VLLWYPLWVLIEITVIRSNTCVLIEHSWFLPILLMDVEGKLRGLFELSGVSRSFASQDLS
jgi:hypothetical protein